MALSAQEKQVFLDFKKNLIQYKKWLILAIVILIIPIISYKVYQNIQLNKSKNNSIIYEQLVSYLNSKDYDSVLDQGEMIKTASLNDPYRTEMYFLLANALYHSKQTTQAINTLALIAQSDAQPFYKNIANLEMTRLYMDNGEYIKAEEMINGVNNSSFNTIKNYYLAQIYTLTGRSDLAEKLLNDISLANSNNQALSQIVKAQKNLIVK